MQVLFWTKNFQKSGTKISIKHKYEPLLSHFNEIVSLQKFFIRILK